MAQLAHLAHAPRAREPPVEGALMTAWPDPCPVDAAVRLVLARTPIEVIVRCPYCGSLEVIDR